MSISSGEPNGEAAALAASLTSQDAMNSAPGQTVPLHVVQAMRDELRAEKEKNETFRNHFQMMNWQNQKQAQSTPDPFEGADPEDSIKVKDAKRMINDFAQMTQSQIAEIKLAQSTPDYREVIQKYLPKAAQEDPELLEEIKRSANPYKAAYKAAKASDAYQQDLIAKHRQTNSYEAPKPKVDPEAEKIVKNSKQSGNLASVGNNASVAGTHPSFKNMTDAEFMAYKNSRLFRAAK